MVIVQRLFVLAAGICAVIALGGVDLPGLGEATSDLGQLRTTSLVAIGLEPFVSACLVVEVVHALWHWIRGRRRQPRDRGRGWWNGVVALTIVLAVLQASGLYFYLESLAVERGVAGPSVVMVVAVVGATLGLLGLARAMSKFGLGDGIAAVAGLGLVLSQGDDLALPGAVGWILVAAMTLFAVGILRRPATVELPSGERVTVAAIPTGLVPLATAMAALNFAVTPSSGDDVGPGTVYALITLAVTTVLFTVLTWRPTQRASLLARYGLLDDADLGSGTSALQRHRRSSMLVSVAAFAVILVAGLLGAKAFLVPLFVAAVLYALDLRAELGVLGRFGGHVAVAEVHDFERAVLLLQVLEGAQIPVFVRNLELRRMFGFFGPHLALQVRVPSARESAARHAIELLDAGALSRPG